MAKRIVSNHFKSTPAQTAELLWSGQLSADAIRIADYYKTLFAVVIDASKGLLPDKKIVREFNFWGHVHALLVKRSLA